MTTRPSSFAKVEDCEVLFHLRVIFMLTVLSMHYTPLHAAVRLAAYAMDSSTAQVCFTNTSSGREYKSTAGGSARGQWGESWGRVGL